MKVKYYDGTKLLSLKDINGNIPELYLCTTNRTGGKTTYFSRLLMNRFIRKNEKFMLLYRFNYELDSVSDKFFKDISSLFYPNYAMTSKRESAGVYHTLHLLKSDEDDPEDPATICGYAVALNNADAIKKYGHLFSDVQAMFMDEFQSETNHYCNNEIDKFISVHTTVARGQGKQYRYVPVYMCGNPISLINPYYTALGISDRLHKETKFLRGPGWILEQGFNASASEAQQLSAFNQAFKNSSYIPYATQGIYLDDNMAFIERPSGLSHYLATITYCGHDYAIRSYDNQGIMYCDSSADPSFRLRIAVTTDDHKINYVMLQRNDVFIQQIRYLFDRGCFRFRNLQAKEALMKLVSY